MSAKHTCDADGQDIVVLEYRLTEDELLDFTISRYIAFGTYRRNILIERVVFLCGMPVFAILFAYWLDFSGVVLAGFVAALVILVVIRALKHPQKHLQRFSTRIRKLIAKDPIAFTMRRLALTPDTIEQWYENHSESTSWKGIREIVERDDTVCLCTGDWNAYIIPKRILGDDGLSCERLLEIARRYHGRAHPPENVPPVAH